MKNGGGVTPFKGLFTLKVGVKNQASGISADTAKIIIELEPAYPIYGVSRLIDNNTSPTWTRTDDGVGLTATANKHTTKPSTFTPAKDDFAMGAHGGELYFYKDIDIVNMRVSDGAIVARLSDPDSGFVWTGTRLNDEAVDVMTYYPGHYIKRWQDPAGTPDAKEYIQLSMWNFKGAMYIEPYYRGTFEAVTGTKDSKIILRSYVGANPNPHAYTTIGYFREYAGNNNNNKMSIGDWRDFDFLCLYLIKYADYNSQGKVGTGVAKFSRPTGYGGAHTTLLGRDGYIGSGETGAVWCLGLCNPWGNVWEFVDGIYINDKQAYVATTGSYNDSGAGDNYIKLGYPNLTGSDVWVSKLGYDKNNPLIALPEESGGDGSTGVCDKYWSKSEVALVLRGGQYDFKSNAPQLGAFSFECNYDFTDVGTHVGCRLLKTA